MQITLANLSSATKQQVFDHIARHLLTQAEQSASDEGCAYRTGQLACAAGACMSDEEYLALNSEDVTNDFGGYGVENVIWSALVRDGHVPAAHAEMIGELQQLHDSGRVAAWPDELTEFAKFRNLSTAVVEELKDSFVKKRAEMEA